MGPSASPRLFDHCAPRRLGQLVQAIRRDAIQWLRCDAGGPELTVHVRELHSWHGRCVKDDEPPARAKHASSLGEDDGGIREVVQHAAGEDRVEAPVAEGKASGVAGDAGNPSRRRPRRSVITVEPDRDEPGRLATAADLKDRGAPRQSRLKKGPLPRSSAQGFKGLAGEPPDRPLVHGPGARGPVEVDRRVVPVQDRPVQPGVATLDADP